MVEVLRLRDLECLPGAPDLMPLRAPATLVCLLARFGMVLQLIPAQSAIPGSYWGDDEAGLISNTLYARADTPLHSILHEASHWITCSPEKRAILDTDAADNQDEENATCYLQLLLADHLPGFGRARAFTDMDAWGYSFRLGSAARWFNEDASAERAWLKTYGLIDDVDTVLFCVRSKA
jgi:hypothetical protein